MIKNLALITGLSVLLSGCANLNQFSQTDHSSKQQITTKDLNQQLMMSVLWVQKSAEYQALCHQAFNIAKLRVNQSLNEDHQKPLAVIVDIDETIFNNSPYEAWLIGKNQGYSSKTWQKWVKEAKAQAIPGSIRFLTYAKEHGVSVFYITNRKEKGRKATLQNLKKLGFPDANNGHLLMRTTSSNKAPRRDQVRKHYDVAVYMGDNLADFTNKFAGQPMVQRAHLVEEYRSHWGNKFIVLPNPEYGDWAGALIHYKWGATAAEKNKMYEQALERWNGQ